MNKNQFIILRFIIALFALIILLNCQNNDNPYSQKFGAGVSSGTIESPYLGEASGLVASRSNPDHFWVINDSGNKPQVHLINQNGQLVHSYWIENESNFDWEDMAIYSDPESGESQIFIADIGDNFAIRDHIKVIVIPEPTFANDQDTIISPSHTYYFRYEDGPRDAEAMLVDPWNADLYIISKREKNVRIYQAPQYNDSSDTTLLDYQASLPFHNVTAGDISASGNEILLKNYNAIFYWTRNENESIPETLIRQHEILRYSPEPQGESIAWDGNGNGYFTLSEKNEPKEQIFYFYQRKK